MEILLLHYAFILPNPHHLEVLKHGVVSAHAAQYAGHMVIFSCYFAVAVGYNKGACHYGEVAVSHM